jgi:hypothetical protein
MYMLLKRQSTFSKCHCYPLLASLTKYTDKNTFHNYSVIKSAKKMFILEQATNAKRGGRSIVLLFL